MSTALLNPCVTTAPIMACEMARRPARADPWLIVVILGVLGVVCPGADWSIRLGYADSRTYRWVDDTGAVHYSDRIPPAQIEQGHTRLSQEGIRTETVAPAATAEEMQRMQERERLQQEEARRIAQEKADNQAILQQFRSLEDLTLAREGKVAAVEALSQTTRDDIRFEQRRLRELHKQTAELKRTEKPVAAHLQDAIAKSEQLIRDGYATIIEQEFRKESIREEFDQMMLRYRNLRQLPESAEATGKAAAGSLSSNLVICHDSEQCHQTWEKALAYVRAQADIRDEILGPGLLIAAQQDAREDRLLTLVWIQNRPEEPVYLYLDLECKNRLTANLTCTNQAAMNVRDGFRAALTGASRGGKRDAR